MVVAGLYLGHRMPTLMSARSRLQMDAFWQMTKFLLEGLVFLVVGLQLRHVLGELNTSATQVVLVTAVVLLVVVGGRFVWLYPTAHLARLILRLLRREVPEAPAAASLAVISWAGMRGVVTLATALALPATLGGQPYPRDLFVWLAFAVIVCTLVLQGTTLPTIARWAQLPADNAIHDTLAEAQVQNQASRAALSRLDEQASTAPDEVIDRLRRVSEHRSNAVWERMGRPGETPSRAYVRLRRQMLEAEREVFRVARDEGRIPEEVLVRAQRQMDLEESYLERSEDT